MAFFCCARSWPPLFFAVFPSAGPTSADDDCDLPTAAIIAIVLLALWAVLSTCCCCFFVCGCGNDDDEDEGQASKGTFSNPAYESSGATPASLPGLPCAAARVPASSTAIGKCDHNALAVRHRHSRAGQHDYILDTRAGPDAPCCTSGAHTEPWTTWLMLPAGRRRLPQRGRGARRVRVRHLKS